MWIYALMDGIIDPRDFQWTHEDIITYSLMYTIQGPYGGARLYRETQKDGAWYKFGFGTLPFVSQPVAISEFPYDLGYKLPLSWARRGGNVKKRYVHEHGGHLAAYEVPELLLHDIWDWFGDGEVSGTSVLR